MKSSSQFENDLCQQLEQIRLARNVTQQQLADKAGVSRGTIIRMEKGSGCTLNTFIRVLSALSLGEHLEELLPATALRPVDRVRRSEKPRRRARPDAMKHREASWQWADESVSGPA